MTTAPIFAPQTIYDAENHRRKVVQVVRCDHCPEEHSFNVNTRSGGMADDTIIRKVRLLGWDISRKGRDRTCPRCVRAGGVVLAMHKLNSEPQAMRAALTIPPGKTEEQVVDSIRLEAVLDSGAPTLAALEERIAESGAGKALDKFPVSERIKQEPKPMKETTVASRRQPSREDKRRVLDKLNEVYSGEEVGYSGDWSDAKVAAALSVPVRWVSDLRIEFHGENAGNEAGDKEARQRRRQINELRTDLNALEAKFMQALSDCEKAIGPIKARLAKLDGGAS